MHDPKPTGGGPTNQASAACPPNDEGLDPREMLRAVGGDAKLLKELLELFLATCPGLVDDVHRAIAAQDGPALRRAAHTLKGAAGSIRVAALQSAALPLETMGQVGNLQQAALARADLDRTVARLLPALERLLNEGGGA